MALILHWLKDITNIVLYEFIYKEAKILLLWCLTTLSLYINVLLSVLLSAFLSVCLSFCLSVFFKNIKVFKKRNTRHLRLTVDFLFWIELNLKERPILFLNLFCLSNFSRTTCQILSFDTEKDEETVDFSINVSSDSNGCYDPTKLIPFSEDFQNLITVRLYNFKNIIQWIIQGAIIKL